MSSLEALFGGLGEFKDDLIAFGMMGAGGIAANIAWDFIFAQANSMLGGKIPESVMKYAKPLAGIALGVYGGNLVSRKFNRNIGQGIAVGMAITGIRDLLNAFGVMPGAQAALPAMANTPAAGLFGDYLNGAPVQVEEVHGAPVTIEAMNGLRGNVAAAFTA